MSLRLKTINDLIALLSPIALAQFDLALATQQGVAVELLGDDRDDVWATELRDILRIRIKILHRALADHGPNDWLDLSRGAGVEPVIDLEVRDVDG